MTNAQDGNDANGGTDLPEDSPEVSEHTEPNKLAASGTKSSSIKGGSMLGAAMLGLGEVLEPEKAKTDVVIEQRLDSDDDLGKTFDLDFGGLDSLDPQTEPVDNPNATES